MSFVARVAKAERVSREHAGSSYAPIPIGGVSLLIPVGMTSRTGSIMMYTLAIPNHEDVEVDSRGTFSVGQCVILYVRSRNAENTRFFPGSGDIEADDKCARQ